MEVGVGKLPGVVICHLTGKFFLFTQIKDLGQLAKKGLEPSVGWKVGSITESQVPLSHLVEENNYFQGLLLPCVLHIRCLVIFEAASVFWDLGLSGGTSLSKIGT